MSDSCTCDRDVCVQHDVEVDDMVRGVEAGTRFAATVSVTTRRVPDDWRPELDVELPPDPHEDEFPGLPFADDDGDAA